MSKILTLIVFSFLVIGNALLFNFIFFTLTNILSSLLNANNILNIIIMIFSTLVSSFVTTFIIAFTFLFKRMPLRDIMRLVMRFSCAAMLAFLFPFAFAVALSYHQTIEKSFDSFVKSIVISSINVNSKYPLLRPHEIIVDKVVVLPRNGIFTSDAVTLAEHKSYRDLELERTCFLCLHGIFDCPLICEIKENLGVYPKPIDMQTTLFFEKLLLCERNSYKRYFYLKIQGEQPFEVILIDEFTGAKYKYNSQPNYNLKGNHFIYIKNQVKCIPCKYYIVIKNLGEKEAMYRLHSGFEEVCEIMEVVFINPNAIKIALLLPLITILLTFILYNLRAKRKRRIRNNKEKIELFIEKS